MTAGPRRARPFLVQNYRPLYFNVTVRSEEAAQNALDRHLSRLVRGPHRNRVPACKPASIKVVAAQHSFPSGCIRQSASAALMRIAMWACLLPLELLHAAHVGVVILHARFAFFHPRRTRCLRARTVLLTASQVTLVACCLLLQASLSIACSGR